jgi:FtsZ-interacting cell division protein ZipA
MRAASLDEFCAAVDIQFVLHVVEATGGVFAGTKLRGVAEAAGLALEGDGVFCARDEAGRELFTVANLGAERLEAESIKSLATHGLTLSMDVPRVSDGAVAFDRMLAVARQLAAALGGVLVDAQRAPLSDAMIDAIRAKTAELQQRMRDGGIAPGSTRALRLFS